MGERTRPRRILEIGAGDAAATLSLAASLDADGMLIAIEPDPALAAEARRRCAEAGLADRVSVIAGEPARYLHKIRGPFDLIVERRPDANLRARLHALLAPGGALIDATGHAVTKYSE